VTRVYRQMDARTQGDSGNMCAVTFDGRVIDAPYPWRCELWVPHVLINGTKE